MAWLPFQKYYIKIIWVFRLFLHLDPHCINLFGPQHSQFSVFRPVRVDGQFKLKALATVYAPEFDLIDFAVTPSGYLVALWTNPDGLPVLR